MKSGIKKTTTLIISTAATLFTLVTSFTATIAWFASMNNVTATGMTITVKMEDSDIQSLTVHKCILSASTSSVLKFEETPSVTVSGHGVVEAASGIEMNDYSTLNQTQPVLLLFTFQDGIIDNAINLTASTESDSFVTAATNSNIGAFPFSSASNFKCVTYSSQSFPFDNVLTNSLSSPISFVALTKDGNGNVTSTSFNNNLNIYTGASNTTITYLAVILDYYADAIDYIVKNTNYEVFSTHNNCIDFFCDWMLSL